MAAPAWSIEPCGSARQPGWLDLRAALASDTPIDNAASEAAHRALGFAESERVVFFAKPPR
ncbi:MAG TPA: hypothetical protein VGO85_16095 [Caldimonas sp.]|jgi:aminoglycoside 6'-N-acetyltransferase I|nr:hypothetical protein [Caldimonas sp.]